MGDNSSTDNKVVVQSTAVEANHTEDVHYYVSTRTGEVFRVQVSIEICCQVSSEDKRCDLLLELEEALSKTVVGLHGLTKKMHISEYHGTVWATPGEALEFS